MRTIGQTDSLTIVRMLSWFGPFLLTVSLAGAQPESATNPVVLHEQMPRDDGIVSGVSEDAAILFEDSADLEGAGDEISTSGASMGSEEDLVYRTYSAPSGDREDVHTVDWEVQPDRETERQPWLRYHAVFDPAVIPFKRNSSWDRVRDDGGLVVGAPELVNVSVIGNQLERGRQAFWGSVLVDVRADTPVPIPSVAPSSRILGFDTAPQVALKFYKDGADNFYLSAGAFTGRLRVNVRMDAPDTWFQRPLDAALSFDAIPAALRPTLPPGFSADVAVVTQRIGVSTSQGYRSVLRRLVRWFRSFRPGQLTGTGTNLYRQLALGKKGICRHRAYAFVVTAHGLGIPARYVANEAHVFVEVYIPDGQGWLRIDLGGGALGMTVRNGADKSLHEVKTQDPFDQPPEFLAGYSHRAFQPDHQDGAVGDEIHGLPNSERAGSVADGGAAGHLGTGASGHGIPLGEAVPFEVSAGQMPTQTRLDDVSAQVYRGHKLSIAGAVNSGLNPMSGAMVRINLMAPDGRSIRRVLGTALTNARGVFHAEVMVPYSVAPGLWDVVAEFVGDDEFAPSHSD